MRLRIRAVTGWVLLAAAVAVAQDTARQPPEAPSRTGQQAQPGEPFSVAIAERLLSELRGAIIGLNRNRTLALFDRSRMSGYAAFERNMGLLFERYASFRVRYRILQTAEDAEGDFGIVEFTLEGTPVSDAQPPVRRSQELRFTFSRAGKDWKIIDLQPRDFFAAF